MSLLEFDRMEIERSERVRETVKRERGRERKGKGVGGREGPQRCPGTPGTGCLSLTLTHFPGSDEGLYAAPLCSSDITPAHQQPFTPIAEMFWLVAFGAEEEKGIWPSGSLVWDCCESAQINCERRALGELFVVWQKYSSWRFCVGFLRRLQLQYFQ